MDKLSLIIGEKPSQARMIAQAVGAYKKQDGYMEGSGYLVSYCYGHLYELCDLEEYLDQSYHPGDKVLWRMDSLPFYPEEWKFRYREKLAEGVDKQIRVLSELMNREDVGTIYAAGDPDREGEVIVRLVLENGMKSHKPVKRLWLPALTPSAIRKGIEEAGSIMDYTTLEDAGKARAALDWLIGIELTRYATLKTGSFLRIGRCISPIVTKIVEREQEIRSFVPENYLSVVSKTLVDELEIELDTKKRFGVEHKKEAEDYAEVLNSRKAVVTHVERKRTTIHPPKLFSMSDLQSYACRKDKTLTPADVLDAVQQLYEHGCVTYPRTGSNYLSEEESGTVQAVIDTLTAAGYTEIGNRPGDRRIYDSSRVESHSALIPTVKLPDGKIPEKAALIYGMILHRFFAVFCSKPCLADRTEMKISCGDEQFTLTGSVLVQQGWQKYETSEKKDRILPDLKEGTEVPVLFKPVEKTTTPPKRFTVETLNAWMKAPMRSEKSAEEYSDAEWKDILSEATICTEATRAETIERCSKSGYIELKNGTYRALEKGEHLVNIMEELHICLTPEKTVELSRDLHEIIEGKMTPEGIYGKARTRLDEIFRYGESVPTKRMVSKKSGEAVGVCPRCGEAVREFGKGYGCSGCSFVLWKNDRLLEKLKMPLSRETAALLLKEGRVFVKGLYSVKKDRNFDAWVVLDDTGKYVNYRLEFPPE